MTMVTVMTMPTPTGGNPVTIVITVMEADVLLVKIV